jgi:hypothetical protein
VSKTETTHEPNLDRREAFQAAASELDATFVQGKWTSGDQVHVEHGPWKVILDTYVVHTGQVTITYTRAKALYVAKEDFTLHVIKRNFFTRIAELFGFYGLLVGDQELERKYKIKSSNDPRGRSLMMDRRLRELIMVQPSLQLDVRRLSWGKRRKKGEGVRSVTVQTSGVIKDPDRLANYVRVVAATLDQLVKIGVAHEEPVLENRTYTLSRRG